MPETATSERCRLVLVSPDEGNWQERAERLGEAMAGGDIASVILWPGGLNEDEFQKMCETVVPSGQSQGIAMIVADEMRIARRVGADGIHVEDRREMEQLADRASGLIIGTGGVKTRHEALELGECRPDYMFFGRFGHDRQPHPHPRNLSLAEWWSELIEIPCIVAAGSLLETIGTAAMTGAEFVAVSAFVFHHPDGPAAAVEQANRLLDEIDSARDAER